MQPGLTGSRNLLRLGGMHAAVALWTRVNGLATVPHYAALVGALGAAQLAFAAAFWLKLRRLSLAAPPAYFPRVTVIVASKGGRYGFAENILSLLDQDYPGRVEYVFVAPVEDDPAYRALQELLPRRKDAAATLLASRASPANCSGKIVDMLFALERADPASEVLVFADDDILVERDWLAEMVAPLRDPGVVAATVPPVCVCAAPNLWTLLHMAWIGFLVPYVAAMPVLFGLSWAVRRRDFLNLGIPTVWRDCLNDDFPLTPLLTATGRRIAWPRRAVPATRESFTWAQFAAQSVREVQVTRLYFPASWLLQGLGLAGKVYLAAWLLSRHALAPLGAMIGLDALTLFLVFAVYGRFLPRAFDGMAPAFRAYPLWTALTAPLLPLVNLAFFLVALARRDVRWGGRVYRMKGARVLDVTQA